MKKFNDIFSIDFSTGGGKRLIKNIINKYRLGNEYKEIKENIENKGGSSNDAVYYKAIKENNNEELEDLLKNFVSQITIGVYFCEWGYGGILYTWNGPFNTKTYPNRNIFGISMMPVKVSNSINNMEVHSFEDLFEQLKDLPNGKEMKELFYQYFELSTKEEIEKYMNEQTN